MDISQEQIERKRETIGDNVLKRERESCEWFFRSIMIMPNHMRRVSANVFIVIMPWMRFQDSDWWLEMIPSTRDKQWKSPLHPRPAVMHSNSHVMTAVSL